ncbi:MAG: hypothetical protein J5679_02940 [Alphaproteobacteria bacterium]|nr:hypothetical protein [Alphaproteobacteria bacterium]
MMKELSSLYAALEQNPVTISYPDGQPAQNSEGVNKFKRDNAFSTYYDFGKYRLEHTENEKDSLEYLDFGEKDSGASYAIVYTVHIEQDGRCGITTKDAPWMNLYKQIKNKAAGKQITNPFYDKISDAASTLFHYVDYELPYGSMSDREARRIYLQLSKIKTKLLATQTIKQKG